MTEEYGYAGNVLFLRPEDVRMYDSEGNVMLCKCGKPASGGCLGKDAYLVWCCDCDPNAWIESGRLIYKPPDEQKMADSWIKDWANEVDLF